MPLTGGLSSPVGTQYAEGQSEEQREEEQLVHSDLWKTVFRGGYMVSKFTRSLSGAFVSVLTCESLRSLLLLHVMGPLFQPPVC